jgi:hypothetical protein
MPAAAPLFMGEFEFYEETNAVFKTSAGILRRGAGHAGSDGAFLPDPVRPGQ